ncbi:hypothetical protein BDK51DRAFT_53043 [Blyttiomyces helicus]|uniref:Uncharacterized protein n=1 Tax=Blyttiomyces helicus TaxID=388810 RepID=A0A4P9WDP8_9FUNG|nr:hypothetical protein BDK51DRAFT_53043 [Blyttiomyces helicus]|eukprot:RKO89358.1 hypothetical protein BDK51DRAFT_53043 [Blyttiomyces helicus]
MPLPAAFLAAQHPTADLKTTTRHLSPVISSLKTVPHNTVCAPLCLTDERSACELSGAPGNTPQTMPVETVAVRVKGSQCRLSVNVQPAALQEHEHSNALTLSLVDLSTGAHWHSAFSPHYIEEITKKTGNFKRFSVFAEMLLTSLQKARVVEGGRRGRRGMARKAGRTNKTVMFDILTSDDLLSLKSPQNTSRSKDDPARGVLKQNEKVYLILTYAVAFDRVHYPLPLACSTEESPAALNEMICAMRQQIADLSEERLSHVDEISKLESEANREIRRMYKEIESLKSLHPGKIFAEADHVDAQLLRIQDLIARLLDQLSRKPVFRRIPARGSENSSTRDNPKRDVRARPASKETGRKESAKRTSSGYNIIKSRPLRAPLHSPVKPTPTSRPRSSSSFRSSGSAGRLRSPQPPAHSPPSHNRLRETSAPRLRPREPAAPLRRESVDRVKRKGPAPPRNPSARRPPRSPEVFAPIDVGSDLAPMILKTYASQSLLYISRPASRSKPYQQTPNYTAQSNVVNLITNGGAEQMSSAEPGTAAGWTIIYNMPMSTAYLSGTGNSTTMGLKNSVGPNPGLRYFSYQDIHLNSTACGQAYVLSGWFGGLAADDDSCTLSIWFYDTLGVVIASEVTVGGVAAADRGYATGMVPRASIGTVPESTAKLTVFLKLDSSSGRVTVSKSHPSRLR